MLQLTHIFEWSKTVSHMPSCSVKNRILMSRSGFKNKARIRFATAHPAKPTSWTLLLEVFVRSHGARIKEGITNKRVKKTSRTLLMTQATSQAFKESSEDKRDGQRQTNKQTNKQTNNSKTCFKSYFYLISIFFLS